jgi:formylglycine-generating enzyme required for sulfatase activity
MKAFVAIFFLIVAPAMLRAQTTRSAEVEPPAGTRIVHPIDGAIMVYVPAGEFVMGINPEDATKIARDLGFTDAKDLWAWDAYPRRTVLVSGFFVDQCEVTVERWRKFVAANPQIAALTPKYNTSEAPVDQLRAVGEIKWAQAQDYANWCGKSLPTNAQWEKAARGTDGRYYPWGNDPPTSEHLSQKLAGGAGIQPLPVGQYPRGASPYGALDMLGNQYEWVDEWLEPYPNNPEAEKMKTYTGHRNGTLRGGSTFHGPVGFYTSKRMGMEPGETYFHVGFRTIWEPPAGYFNSKEFEEAKAKADKK